MKIAPGLHRVGPDKVNAYLVEEAGRVTVIDAAMPGFWGKLPGALAEMGRTLDDVEALVLTHGHPDHIGFAERLRSERQVPVSVHEADAALARGEVPNPAQGLGPIKLGPLLAFMWLGLRNGGLSRPKVLEVSTFGDGATLDVPGSPPSDPGAGPHAGQRRPPCTAAGRAVRRRCARDLCRDERPARATGCAVHRRSGRGGRVAGPAERRGGRVGLAGHGPAWTGGVPEAIAQVRQQPPAR